MAKKPAQVPGLIGASDLYTVGEIKRRLGISSWSMWRARRNGLKVYKIDRRSYVLGKDYIHYVEVAGRLPKRMTR